ncbi:MAG: T9SS C-terminal target domain-containing protein, partial [Ignavibacteriae bacterium]
ATGGETTVQRTINMVAKPQPTITRISPLPGAVGGACLNEEVEYGNTDLVAANPSWSYQWTVSNGVINPLTPATGATIKVAWNTVGTGTLTLAKWHTGSQCTTVVSQTINITNKPAPAIAGPTVVCGGEENTYTTPAVAGNTYLWSVAGATLVSGSTANSAIVRFPNPANLTSTSATVSVVETNVLSGCQGNASIVVTINYMPQATTIAGLTTVCNNSTTTYSIAGEPAGLTYTWSVTGGAITSGAGTSSINVEWSSVGNQTVSVTMKNGATDCEKTISRVVTVEYQPAPSIAGDASVCTGESVTYSTPANAGSTYAWSLTGGTITSGLPAQAPSVSVLWTVAGNQTITVTETNASGNCVGTKTLNVVVVATPIATNITRIGGGSVDKACETDVITYGTNIPNASGMTFYWTVTGGSFQGGNTNPTATVQWNIQGEQVLTVKITTAGSDCSVTVTQNVAVTYKPTPNIDGATVACINKDHVYQTPYVAGSTYVWSITPTNVFAPITGYPNSNVIEVKWIQPGLHTITLTETNIAGGCLTTVSMNVQVNLIPTPFTTSTTGFGNPSGLRPGIVCNFSTHTYTTTATPGNTFIWTVTGGNITGGQYTNTISVAWGPAGTGTIAVQETIPGSDCITTKLDTILIRPTPTPVITGTNLNPCAGSVQTYSTPFVQGNSYYWDVPVGGTILSGQNSNQITVQWSSSVTWPNIQATSLRVTEWVTQVAPNAGLSAPYGAVTSCYGQATTNITIRPNPSVPTISGTAVVCASDLSDDPQTVNIYTYNSSIPVQNFSVQGTISYAWSTTSNGVIVGSSTGSSVQIWWSNTGTTPTTGTIFLTHTSSWGCTSSNQFTVTVNPLPNPDINGPTSVCQNSLQTYSTAGFPGHVYNWTVNGGNIIRSGQGTPSVTVEWTLPGSYTLQVTETNTYGCTVLNNTYVTVNELPVAEVTASGPTTFCQGGDVTLSAPIGFASYVWSTGETARSIVVRTTGQYWVKVTDENGCSNSSDTITVNVFPNTLPIITVSGPTTFCEGGSVTLTAPNGFSAYLWSTGATTQSITVTESGAYTVTIADGNGCTGTSTDVDVFVNPAPAPVLTVVGSTTVCSGDSVEVRAPAGYVSYTWVATSGTNYGSTRSIWILQTDTVYAQVVDANGCVGQSDVVAITVAPVVAPTIAANGPTTFCDGNSVKLSAPEGFATYYWSNGATTREIVVENGGDYSVTVTNNAACPSASAPTAVVVNPLPARPSITRTGDTLKTVSMQAETFQWFRNGVMIPGAEERNLVVALPGTYRVEIGDNNTCTSKSDGFDVILTDVDEDVVAGHGAELRVFPNPTTGQFTIETAMAEAGNVKIELVNTVGENVMTLNEISNGGSFSMNVDMGTLASGVYNVVVTTANERWTVRLVRQ